MEKKLYFNIDYEAMASLLFSFRFLFYNSVDGQASKLVAKEFDYQSEQRQIAYLEVLFSLDDFKHLEQGLYKLTNYYKTQPHLISEASLFALNEYIRTNNLLPASGEWANSSDGFIHLVAYSLRAYAKEGKYLLDREQTFANIETITKLTHSNMRVVISHTIFFALLAKMYEYRLANNGKTLNRRQVANLIDEALRKVLYHYRDYQYLGELRYFVRLDKQLYDHATTILPSSQIQKIKAKELRAANYVVDSVETLLYTLLKFNKYQNGLDFIADIPGVSAYNLMLYTLLYSLSYGLPKIIKTNISREFFEENAILKPLINRYKSRAFHPIRSIVNLIVSEQISESEQLEVYAKQIEFEFERIGYSFNLPPLSVFKTPKTVAESYYQLYLLVRTSKKFDALFVGHIILINNIINL